MNPLRIAAGVVSLLSEMVAREYRKVQLPHWPDGEQPLIDEPQLFDDNPFLSDSYLRYYNSSASEPLAGWFRGGFEDEVSAGSAIEARVDAPADEVPTPGRAHTPGVGHPNVTASLLISASIGLRDYADSDACEAPVYWRSIASQLDPK